MRKKLSALMCLLFLTLVSCGEEQTPTHLPPSPLDKDIENQFRNMEFSLTPVSKEGCTLSALTLTNTTDYPFYLIDAGFSEKKAPSKKLYAKQKARFQAAMGENFSSRKYDAFREEKPLSGRAQRLKRLEPGEDALLLIHLDHYIGKTSPLSDTDEALLSDMLPCLKSDGVSFLIKDKRSRYRWIHVDLPKGEEKDNTVSLDKRVKLMTYSEDWPFKESDIPVFPGSHLHGYVDIKTGDTTLVIYNTTKEEFAQYKATCLKARKKNSLIPEMVEDRLVIADKKAGRLFIIFRDEKNATVTIENHHA